MIDIVVVNWNGGHLVKSCIESVFKNSVGGILNMLVIVDNNSADQSVENLPADPRIRLIRNRSNLGFAKACNQGFKMCSAEFVLLLNPDAQLLPNTLTDCLGYMYNHADIDILGVRLLNDAGHTTASCARFPTPLHIFYDASGLSKLLPKIFTPSTLMTDWDHSKSCNVDQVMGAFMFMRKSIFEKLGYFDERFFVYYEELDFSKRLAEAGGITFFNTDIVAIHSGEGTTTGVKAFRLFLSLRSRLQYAQKHFSTIGFIIVWLSTWAVEIFSRTFIHLIKGQWSSIQNVWKGYGLLLNNNLN